MRDGRTCCPPLMRRTCWRCRRRCRWSEPLVPDCGHLVVQHARTHVVIRPSLLAAIPPCCPRRYPPPPIQRKPQLAFDSSPAVPLHDTARSFSCLPLRSAVAVFASVTSEQCWDRFLRKVWASTELQGVTDQEQQASGKVEQSSKGADEDWDARKEEMPARTATNRHRGRRTDQAR